MSYYSYDYNGGGRRGGFMSNVPPAVKNILIINVLMFLATMVNEQYMISHFALFYPASPLFKFWQPITHMFMHGGFWHIFFNMYTFYIFGSVLERQWGTKKFLLFYFVTGLGAALLHTGVEGLEAHRYITTMAEGSHVAANQLGALYYTPTVGASGAIYGLLIGYAMLYPDSIMSLIFPPISMKAKWFVLIFAAIELLTGISGTGGGVAHFAHLGGMLFGWMMMRWWKKKGKLYTDGL